MRAFEDRETHVLDGLARRLRRAATGDADPFEVFNNAQDHVLRAARVHTDRVVLEAFVAAIDRCADPAASAAGTGVRPVRAEQRRRRPGLVPRPRPADGGSRQRGERCGQPLCEELRPHARTLVDAFAIPERFLEAAILRA